MVSAEILAAGFTAGLCGGALAVIVVVHFFWNKLMANRYDWEEAKAGLKEIRNDLHSVAGRCRSLEDRVEVLEHPPFKPKFGDWVNAEREDKSGMEPAVYLGSNRGGTIYRVVAKRGDNTSEYDTELVEPLK